ncbi:hypothetical protein DITRI_Ditri17bG0078900 [Diplodiscus trichospermus]
MRGNSILRPFLLRHAFNFRSISSSSFSFSPRFPMNQNYYLLSTPKSYSSFPKIPFNFTLSRPFSDSSTAFPAPPLSDPEAPVQPNESEEEFDIAELTKALTESMKEPKKPSQSSTVENNNPSGPSRYSSTYPFEFTPSIYETEPEPPVPQNVVLVKSEEEFNTGLSKAEGESVPAVFYFTATWCAPCRLIGPVMEEMARRNPHVTVYKMDIDEERLASKLKTLNITAVPTVHFFKEGKKEDEVVGSDVSRIVQTMKKLYQTESNNQETLKEEGQEGLKKDDSGEEK